MSVDPIETSEAVPRGAIVERSGEMSRAFRNWLERGNRQTGKVISGIATLNSAVQVVQGQITGINGSLETYYGISVDGGGNGAFVRLSDGAAAPSVVAIGADKILLDADAINFGAQTEFDTGSETFITEVGGIRSRYGTAFGDVSSQVVMWHGPTSVAQGSESRTNGYLAIGTDGLIYHNTAALDWGATAAEAAASNAQVGTGANALADTGFRQPSGHWTQDSQSGSVAASVSTRTSGLRVRAAVGSGVTVGNWIRQRTLLGIPCKPGDRVGVRCLLGASNASSIRCRLTFRTAAGAFVNNVDTDLSSGILSGTGEASSFNELSAVGVASSGADAAHIEVWAFASTSAPILRFALPTAAILSAGQTVAPPLSLGFDGAPGADVTSSNTAAAIAGQGVWATGNYYEQTSDPGSVPNGSFWFKTDTNELYVRRSGSWGKVATIANQNITITRTNGFVKTRIGAGTITSDSVSFSSTGGSGTGYTYAHELFVTSTTGPTPTISSASGSPITASATGAVPGDEIRGFVQTTVTDSAGNKATLLSPVALFCES